MLLLTARELKEILHAMHYASVCAHGTTGHNQLMLIDKLATHIGFERQGETLWSPPIVRVDEGPQTSKG